MRAGRSPSPSHMSTACERAPVGRRVRPAGPGRSRGRANRPLGAHLRRVRLVYPAAVPDTPEPTRWRCSLSANPRRPWRAHACAAGLSLATLALAATAHSGAPAKPAAPAASPSPRDSAARKALVIEGDNHLFMISAPEGWVLDDTAGMASRIR